MSEASADSCKMAMCVCDRGVSDNSIQCTSRQKWVHKKCSGIKGSMSKVMKSFICRGCMNPITSRGRTGVDICVGMLQSSHSNSTMFEFRMFSEDSKFIKFFHVPIIKFEPQLCTIGAACLHPFHSMQCCYLAMYKL